MIILIKNVECMGFYHFHSRWNIKPWIWNEWLVGLFIFLFIVCVFLFVVLIIGSCGLIIAETDLTIRRLAPFLLFFCKNYKEIEKYVKIDSTLNVLERSPFKIGSTSVLYSRKVPCNTRKILLRC